MRTRGLDPPVGIILGIKLANYARAGIRRYWVVDIQNRTVHDHRDPDRFGRRYRQLHSVSDGVLSVTIEGIDVQIDVNGLFRV